MNSTKKGCPSTVARKFLIALSGLALVGFVIAHLLGNLTLLKSGDLFNTYAYTLEKQGVLLEVAEVGLFLAFALHILLTVTTTLKNKSARPVGYSMWRSKKGPSKATPAALSMIITGVVIFGFLILHIWQFKFGPSVEQGYVTQLSGAPGHQVRDLYRLVVEVFHNPYYVGIYVAVMLLLGTHLRHGFWSAFQSLGAHSPRFSNLFHCVALGFGLLMAAGFLILPLYIYFYVSGVAT